MRTVYVQRVGAPDSNTRCLLLKDELDVREVAAILQYKRLSLQSKDKKLTAIPLNQANAVWSLGDLTQQTGNGGTESDPFLFSGESAETGMLPM